MGGFLSHLTPEKNEEVLDATCGPIRGNVYRHGDKVVDGYLGIPFAKAPVGHLRFKKPVSADKWSEPRDCYSYGVMCPQTGKFATFLPEEVTKHYPSAEDNCLTLNVIAPRWKSDEFPSGLPVMVYFYGGGFEVGSSQMHDYSISGTLPLKDVIYVSVNYRLGPLGFLTTGDEVSLGNYGLWDQTLGLQWVQQHIASFGGNPNNVTIFGTSAGGASVDLLALSPHSNKLFHRLIACSGTGLCDFAIRTKEVEARIFKEFAQHHGYTGNDSKSLLEWYDSQPLSKFKEMQNFKREASGFLSFVPNFDGDFFPKPFDQLRKEAPKIDAMATVGEYEGLGVGVFVLEGADSQTKFKDIIAETIGADVTDQSESVQQKLLEFYTSGVDMEDKAALDKKFVEFIGDSWFNIGALDTVKSFAKTGNNAYLASFDYFCPETQDPMLDKLPFKAASHGTELRYIIGDGMVTKFTPTEDEFKMMDTLQTYLTNFAKYGNPNGKSESNNVFWEKYSLETPLKYFKIDYPKCEMRDNFQNGRLAIHDEINRNGKKYQEIVLGKKM